MSRKCEQSTYAIAAVVVALSVAAFVYNYTSATGSAAATEQNGTATGSADSATDAAAAVPHVVAALLGANTFCESTTLDDDGITEMKRLNINVDADFGAFVREYVSRDVDVVVVAVQAAVVMTYNDRRGIMPEKLEVYRWTVVIGENKAVYGIETGAVSGELGRRRADTVLVISTLELTYSDQLRDRVVVATDVLRNGLELTIPVPVSPVAMLAEYTSEAALALVRAVGVLEIPAIYGTGWDAPLPSQASEDLYSGSPGSGMRNVIHRQIKRWEEGSGSEYPTMALFKLLELRYETRDVTVVGAEGGDRHVRYMALVKKRGGASFLDVWDLSLTTETTFRVGRDVWVLDMSTEDAPNPFGAYADPTAKWDATWDPANAWAEVNVCGSKTVLVELGSVDSVAVWDVGLAAFARRPFNAECFLDALPAEVRATAEVLARKAMYTEVYGEEERPTVPADTTVVELYVTAGHASSWQIAPRVGPFGLSPMHVQDAINKETNPLTNSAYYAGEVLAVVISVLRNRSYSFVVRKQPTVIGSFRTVVKSEPRGVEVYVTIEAHGDVSVRAKAGGASGEKRLRKDVVECVGRMELGARSHVSRLGSVARFAWASGDIIGSIAADAENSYILSSLGALLRAIDVVKLHEGYIGYEGYEGYEGSVARALVQDAHDATGNASQTRASAMHCAYTEVWGGEGWTELYADVAFDYSDGDWKEMRRDFVTRVCAAIQSDQWDAKTVEVVTAGLFAFALALGTSATARYAVVGVRAIGSSALEYLVMDYVVTSGKVGTVRFNVWRARRSRTDGFWVNLSVGDAASRKVDLGLIKDELNAQLVKIGIGVTEEARGYVDVAFATVDLVADVDDAKEEAIRRLSLLLPKRGTGWEAWEVDAKGVWWDGTSSCVRASYLGEYAGAVAALKQRSENGDLFVGYVDVEIVLIISGNYQEVAIKCITDRLGEDWEVEESTYVKGVVSMGKLAHRVRVWYCGDSTNAGASAAVVSLVAGLKSGVYRDMSVTRFL
jgi:ribosomal protein L11